MITWLFTQVWLWSLCAFALGALSTWLLFVRPLRRRLALPSHPDVEYEDYDEPATYERESAHDNPLDLLQPPPPPRSNPEPVVSDREWPHRPWERQRDSSGTWFGKWDEEAAKDDQVEPDIAVTAVQPRVLPESPAVKTTVEQWPETEPPAEPPRVEPTEAEPPRLEPIGMAVPKTTTEVAPKPEAAVSVAAKPKSRIVGRLEAKPDDATESRLSGQLLPESDGEKPTSSAREESTQVIPRVDGAGKRVPLPQRTPGAGPRPGKAAGSGPMIKGHSASRQYHSPESPQYDQIVADVWFRTAADAEIAGFKPWSS